MKTLLGPAWKLATMVPRRAMPHTVTTDPTDDHHPQVVSRNCSRIFTLAAHWQSEWKDEKASLGQDIHTWYMISECVGSLAQHDMSYLSSANQVIELNLR